MDRLNKKDKEIVVKAILRTLKDYEMYEEFRKKAFYKGLVDTSQNFLKDIRHNPRLIVHTDYLRVLTENIIWYPFIERNNENKRFAWVDATKALLKCYSYIHHNVDKKLKDEVGRLADSEFIFMNLRSRDVKSGPRLTEIRQLYREYKYLSAGPNKKYDILDA